MKTVVGLIGGGYWGKNLIREFNSCNVLHTICEIDDEAVEIYKKQYPHINLTKDWYQLLSNKEINAVCISLPAEMHYKYAKEALEAGKDVYVEKPITLDVNEAKELISLAKERKLILMVGHLLHYHPCIEKIKQTVKNGEIGKVINIISNRLNLGIFRTCENVLWSFAPHDISVILSLCDNELPDTVTCHGKDNLTKDVHDITNTVLKWESKNIYANINVNWLNPFKEQKLTIIGEKGMIVFDDTSPDRKLVLFRDYLSWSETIPTTPIPNKSEGEKIEFDSSKSPLLKECEHFIDCCQNRTKPITDGKEGLRVLQVLKCSSLSLFKNSHPINISDLMLTEKNKQNIFIHDTATVDDLSLIKKGTKIWHYSHISSNCEIGENCSIGQNVFIAPKSKLGDGCKVQNNVSVYSGVECGNRVFLGPSCVFTNDINPRAEYSKNGNYMKTVVEDGATIGANATIICGNTIGKYAIVGAGTVVTKDVEPFAIVVGNPAKRIGYTDTYGNLNKTKTKTN